jgi:hypothetical protein
VGKFIKNKNKRVKKDDKPLLVNTNLDTTVHDKDNPSTKKVSFNKSVINKSLSQYKLLIPSELSLEVKREKQEAPQLINNFENSGNKKQPIFATSINPDKELEKEGELDLIDKPDNLVAYWTPKDYNKGDVVKVKQNGVDILYECLIKHSPGVYKKYGGFHFSELFIKSGKSLKLWGDLAKSNKLVHDISYENFSFKDGLLDNDQIDTINKKINKILAHEMLELSFIDLFFFRAFIKNKSIALIANSSDLLSKKNGDLIDSYDIVVRFNSYKIDKEHTGEKTTIHASIYLQDENLDKYVPIRFIVSNRLDRWAKKLKNNNNVKQGSLLKYNHHTVLENHFKEKHPPTTGFTTLILLLKLGGYEKIDMFGFNFYDDGQNSIFRTENGMKIPISDVHNYNFEKQIIMDNSHKFDKKNNIITFYDYSTQQKNTNS